MTTSTPICTSCGCAPVAADLLEIREFFPTLSPDLCEACYETQRRQEEAAAAAAVSAARERALRAQLVQTIPPKILDTDLAHPTYNKPLHIAASSWRPDLGKWLVIHGPPGTCKTRVVGQIARRLILDHGIHVTWATAGKFQQAAEALATFDRGADQYRAAARSQLARWTKCGCLIFDDLGKNTWSKPFEARLFELIDHRETHYLPTIITANRHPDELIDEMSDDRGGPIIGRILDAARNWILQARPPQATIPHHAR